jgi:hypothetical protein
MRDWCNTYRDCPAPLDSFLLCMGNTCGGSFAVSVQNEDFEIQGVWLKFSVFHLPQTLLLPRLIYCEILKSLETHCVAAGFLL